MEPEQWRLALNWLSWFAPVLIISFAILYVLNPQRRPKPVKKEPDVTPKPVIVLLIQEQPAEESRVPVPRPVPNQPPVPVQVTETTNPSGSFPRKKSREERKREYAERKAAEEAETRRIASEEGEPVVLDQPADETPEEQEEDATTLNGQQIYLLLSPPEGVSDPVLSIVIRIVLIRVFLRPTGGVAFSGSRNVSEETAWHIARAQVTKVGGDRHAFMDAMDWLVRQRVVELVRREVYVLRSSDEARPAGAALIREAQGVKRSLSLGINVRNQGARA